MKLEFPVWPGDLLLYREQLDGRYTGWCRAYLVISASEPYDEYWNKLGAFQTQAVLLLNDDRVQRTRLNSVVTGVFDLVTLARCE